jgi:hypothetical protein
MPTSAALDANQEGTMAAETKNDSRSSEEEFVEQEKKFAEKVEKRRRRARAALVPPTPFVSSINGRNFEYEAPLNLALDVGSYVTIKAQERRYLGQITSKEATVRDGPEIGFKVTKGQLTFSNLSDREATWIERVPVRYVRGSGDLIGEITTDEGIRKPTIRIRKPTIRDVFDNGSLEASSRNIIRSHLSGLHLSGNEEERNRQRNRQRIDIGYALADDSKTARVYINVDGFERHTFMWAANRARVRPLPSASSLSSC